MIEIRLQTPAAFISTNVVGTFILLAALVAHISLALIKLANRTTLRLPPWELAQIALGLAEKLT